MSTEMGTKTTLTGASFGGGLIFVWATLRAAANLCVGNFCVAGLIFAWATFAWWGNVYGGGANLFVGQLCGAG